MDVPTGEFRALTAQVADLAAQIEQLKRTAFILRTFNRDRLERQAALADELAAAPSRRPRHLRAVDSGAS